MVRAMSWLQAINWILSLNSVINFFIILGLSLTWLLPSIAVSLPSQRAFHQQQDFRLAQAKKKKTPPLNLRKKRRNPAKVMATEATAEVKAPGAIPPSELGIGFVGGWEATYGNGLQIIYRKGDLLSQLGFGYNQSGVKFGAGLNYLLWNSPGGELSLPIGLALVRSQGITDTVEIEGEFITESGASEALTGKRKYILSPALYVSPQLGLQWRLTPGVQLQTMLNYNNIVTGNEVEFYGPLEYTPKVVVTNDSEAQQQFEKKAADEVKSGGPGLSVGLFFVF